jgi:beta-phosphoglucomutase
MTIDLRALIFDLDGVMADTNEPHRASWERLSREEGIPFSPLIYEDMMGLPRHKCLDVFLGGRQVNEETAQDYMRRKNQYFLELLDTFTPEDAAPGVRDLILEAREAGLKIGLGSSSQNAGLVLKKLGLYEHFHAIGDGNTVARHKPHPDIFLWVAERLNVLPEQAVVFEDSTAGVQAGKTGGFYVVGIGNALVKAADMIVPTLAGMSIGRLRGYFNRERA